MAEVNYDDILQASKRIKNFAHRTPVLNNKTIDRQTKNTVHFKCENFQKVGAFKFRGAINALSQLAKDQQVITYSSGNHAQAIALAANLLSLSAHIVMPEDAPEIKKSATRGYGANIIFYDRQETVREELARTIAKEQGYTIIPPFDHPHIIAGQGTVAKELIEEIGELDFFIAPCGGGGLLSGCSIAIRQLSPKCKIIGVEPENGNDAYQSFYSKKLQSIDNPMSIADGLLPCSLSDLTFSIIRQNVDEMLTVSDKEIIDAMRWVYERLKIVVEPSGVVGLAALLTGKIHAENKKVGIVFSGGNVDLSRFGKWFANG